MAINSLAEKEKRVMKLLEEGKTFKEIAQEEEKYGEGNVKKYYSNFDAAVEVPL